jgi:hypothetical protein
MSVRMRVFIFIATGLLLSATLAEAGIHLAKVRLSPWPLARGDRYEETSSPKPTLSHFVVENPGVTYTAQQFRTDMLSNAYLPSSKAEHSFFLLQDATIKAWLNQAKSPLEALAFIGHSVENQSTGASLGIQFADKGLVKTGYKYLIPVVKIDVLPTKAKVLFFGSCNVGPVFTSLWGIKANAKGRALIVPSTPVQATNLLNAKIACLTIATVMAQGKTVSEAVQQGNDAVAASPNFGKDKWRVIRDPNAKIVP